MCWRLFLVVIFTLKDLLPISANSNYDKSNFSFLCHCPVSSKELFCQKAPWKRQGSDINFVFIIVVVKGQWKVVEQCM